MSRRSPGFTITEILVAFVLIAIMMGGLGGMYYWMYRGQNRSFAQLAVDNGATTARKVFDDAMREATYIATPGAPSIGSTNATDNLTVYSNWDGGAAIVPGDVKFQHICLDETGSMIYWYWGTTTANLDWTSSTCGQGFEGFSPMLLAGGTQFSVSLNFTRPENNVAAMACIVSLTDTLGVTHESAVAAKAEANATSQQP